VVSYSLPGDLALALSLAANADLVSLNRFEAQDLKVSTKPDRTPVTDADEAVERVIRQGIQASRPTDSIFGEELGSDAKDFGPQPGRQWIIDPIDGTAGFLRGLPIWGTLIALVIDGTPVLGVVSAPALKKRWYAATGHGAWMTTTGSKNPVPLAVSQVGALQDATVSYNSLPGWIDDGRAQHVQALAQGAWRARAIGDFWSYMLVAEGSLDVAGEPDLKPFDMAALVPIVQEAGGRFSSLDGEPDIWHATALATNALLHDEVLSITRKSPA
jgi:histidinol-phosphatase